jgi:thioredoxin 1
LILFTNGRIVNRLEGFTGREDLRVSLDQMTKVATMNWQIGDRGMPMRIDWRLAMSE